MTISKKIILLVLIILSGFFLTAQNIDSVYYLQVISEEDGKGLPFVSVGLSGVGFKWTTDMNGIVKIKTETVRGGLKNKNGEFELYAVATGFNKMSLLFNALLLNDTVILKMKSAPFQLDRIEIVSYVVPLIDPDKPARKRWLRKKKIPVEIKDTAICYSEQELADYKLLLENKYFINDSVKSRSVADPAIWFKLLIREIKYPERAKEWGIEETVYLGFEVSDKGFVQKMRLLKGKNPVLALEVARVLKGMPGIKFQDETYQKKSSRPVKFVLPISFKLR